MSGNNYDQLDKFFQSRLGADHASQEGIAPPRGVLDGAFEVLDAERRRKRRGLIFIFGSGLVLALIAVIFVLASNKLNNIDSKIDALSTRQAVLSDTESVAPDGTLSPPAPQHEQGAGFDQKSQQVHGSAMQPTNDGTDVIGTTDIAARINQPATTPQSTGSELSLSSLAVNAQAVEIVPATMRNATGPDNVSSQSVAQNSRVDGMPADQRNTNTNIAQQQLRVKADIAQLFLPLSTIEPADDRLVMDALKLPAPISTRPNQLSRWTIHVLLGHSLSTIQMKGIGTTDYALTEYDRHYSGSYAELGMSYALTQALSLDIDSRISRLNNESVYTQTMSYDKDNEMIDNSGLVSYRSQMIMESPVGQFSGEAEFTLDGLDVEDKAAMDNVTSIHQCFSVVSASAGLDYALLRKGRFTLRIGSGAGVNYLADLGQDMKTQLYIHGKKIMEDSYAVSTDDKINSLYLSLYGKAGLQYRLTDRLSVGLHGGYEHALSSIRKSSAGDVRTLLHSLESGVIFAYRF